MTDWQSLAAGPELRRIIAERLGWHMRKIWVGANGIEYDFFIYDNDDRLVYQREITQTDLADEQRASDQTWLEAMNDDECPLWDQDLDEALDMAYGLEYDLQQQGDLFHAWVNSPDHSGSAETQALAIVRAWLNATAGKDDFLGST